MKKRIQYLCYLSLFLLSGCLFSCTGKEAVVTEHLEEDSSEETGASEEQEAVGADGIAVQEAENLYVYVCGAVRTPGVYELRSGSRIIDAIEAAGGMNEAAAVSYVNQAELITDGQKVWIPTEEESADLPEEQVQTGDGAAQELVNINTATKEQLMQLSGIGEAKAGSIIAWRESNGSFKTIEDIRNVDGIGDGTFQKLKDFICVS